MGRVTAHSYSRRAAARVISGKVAAPKSCDKSQDFVSDEGRGPKGRQIIPSLDAVVSTFPAGTASKNVRRDSQRHSSEQSKSKKAVIAVCNCGNQTHFNFSRLSFKARRMIGT